MTDDKSEGYYEIAVDEKLADGTVAADKAFAKAGETVTLTVNSTETKKTMIILGVELAEDNSFVMPENKVIISAQIGDGFKATEKEDVIHLAENVKADDIALADFVEFENEELTREFAFALAEGSTLPDGLKLSYGRIVGTPTKAGTYTVVFDVTDPSAAALMSLDKEVAIGTAQLTLTIEVEKTYKVEVENSENGSVTADKEYAKAGEKIALTVAADSGYALESLTGAEFDENNGFVMPESDVKIKAVFAPIFTGTDKDDTVALVQNFAMTPINLGDYVKFADDKVNGTFAFAVAEESALPDGLKLENGTVSGTPTVSGNYKVKFKVTQSAAQLMSLTPEFAVSSAVLELTFDITATYKVNISEIKNGSVTADKEYAKAGESVKLTVTPDEGYTLVGITGVSVDAEKTFVMPAKDVTVGALFKGEDAQITEPVIISELGSDGKYIVKYMVPENMDYCLICAVYNADGTLKSVRTVKAKDDQNNGELTIAAGENTKVMLWKDLESVKPLCNSCELN